MNVNVLSKKIGTSLWAVVSICIIAGEAVGEEITFLFVGDTESNAYYGLMQGLTEANAQGEFLNIRYRLESDPTQDASAIAVVAAVDPGPLLELVERYPDLPVLNTISRETQLRENCRRNLFHITPSRAMLADAERQWRRNNPDSSAQAQAWHRTFRKYAAAQLNSRFRNQFERDMEDDAWAGWAAVKLVADTLARQPKLMGPLLIDELKTNLAFDGQKGIDMNFRETGQLRQPLLLVEGEEIVGEAPVRGVVAPTKLDSLGIPFCAK